MIDIPHFHFERVSSTNDVAKELLDGNNCVFVTAEYQFNGRGRNGRAWEGESHKNIYLTYAVNEIKKKSLANKILYQLIGCLAVEKALSDFIDVNRIKIKYPNDVYVADEIGKYRKISGVLSEHSYSGNVCEESILGIGINVNQTRFDNVLHFKATSLKLLGYECDIDNLISTLKSNLINYFKNDEKLTYDEWKEKVNLIGKKVLLLSTNKEYIIESIDLDGSLLAVNESGSITINNGDSIVYEF